MQVEVLKSELARALSALGKMICRTSPVEAYRSVLIQSGKAGALSFLTTNGEERIEVNLSCTGETEAFSITVPFEDFRQAARNCKTKTLIVDLQGKRIRIAGVAMEAVSSPFPAGIKAPTEVATAPLPSGFVEMLSIAAPIVDRTAPRRILQGVNLSPDGIAVTNGKELLNIPMSLQGVSLTIPFPLALIATKCAESGSIRMWSDQESRFFQIHIGNWCWTAKALPGVYPNWKQIIPAPVLLTSKVRFDADAAEQLATFLRTLPDAPPHNSVTLTRRGEALTAEDGNHLCKAVPGEFTGSWKEFRVSINRDMLLRLLAEGHRQLEFSSDRAPFVASGGIGTYVAMPLHIPAVTVPQIEPQKEVSKMNANETCVVAATESPVVNPIVTEPVNPLDDLGSAIEELKLKIKAMFDESNALSRKVKEVAIAQKQKERDFIQAKRAIERIRMAI